jgi:hypothetical protein
VPVVPIEHFTLDQLMRARKQEARYSYAFVFSTKYDSGRVLPDWLERTQERLFDFHRDLPPQAAADVLGGRILHQERRGGEWIAIMSAGRASEIRLSFLGSR